MAGDAVAVLEQETSTEPQTLKAKYGNLAKEYRNLGIKQTTSAGGLVPQEVTRLQELDRMAKFGLFEAHLQKEQLGDLEVEYQAQRDAETQGFDSEELKAEYRAEYNDLGKKLSEGGLTSPAKQARWRWFVELRRQGKI